MNYKHVSAELLVHSAAKITALKPSQLSIYIDPFKIPQQDIRADILVITHPHQDHCSKQDFIPLIGPETEVITVADCQSKLSGCKAKQVHIVKPGDAITVKGVPIKIVAAYNTDKPFHPKENEWIGLIFTFDDVNVYFAGDTDVIEEMKSLGEIDIAYLPVSGTYVMDPIQAAEAVKIIKPKVAIPMHYGTIVGTVAEAEKFKELANTQVEILR